ncbi:MAG: hypothetical protein HUJ25_12435 [Crocinitomicaceae bacterium]|nr:hypothetical protein [Crocinitomicaceae bacterium]
MREISRARLSNGRLITPHEIHLITGYNEEVAEREHTYIRKALGTQSEDLLLSQFCEYYDLDYFEILTYLSPLSNDEDEDELPKTPFSDE